LRLADAALLESRQNLEVLRVNNAPLVESRYNIEVLHNIIIPPLPQNYGCGNGYGGGQFAALLYGGGVPCNGQTPTPPSTGGLKSNVEDFCVLDYRCV
jgi:hypothetical protein